VGGPPRQGGDKGEPFKRIEFMRADDGEWGERCETSLLAPFDPVHPCFQGLTHLRGVAGR
jgi:hypothetical protein